jgi:hypothetical protein
MERIASTSIARQLIAEQSMRGDDDGMIRIDQIVVRMTKDRRTLARRSLLPAGYCAAMSREALAGRIRVRRELRFDGR